MNPSNILCPIDFSEASRHAVEQATAVAGYYHSRITALHVVTPLALGVVTAEEECDRLERFRQVIAKEFGAGAGDATKLEVLVEVGDPVDTILRRAASLPADLIVMGTHGASGFQHLILGSVTEKVLRRAGCPVLTVPPHTHATSQLPFRQIVCAVDFSDASLSAVRSAASLAHQSGAALTLLCVLEWPWAEPPSPPMDELAPEQGRALAEFRRYAEESATRRLESLLSDDIGAGPVTCAIAHGKPHVEILRLAAREQADLIVMGVRGRNPVDMALFGSTANQVVRRATCPVLTTGH